MRPLLAAELDRLRAIFASVECPFPQTPGATDEQIQALEAATGLAIDRDLADLWRLMNGTGQETVFAVRSDEETPLVFLSTEGAAEFWSWSEEPDDHLRVDQDPPRDARIRHARLAHPAWLPFAEFNGGGTIVYCDTDPGAGGSVGQIIVYQHDPDGLYYVAESVAAFVRQSNEIVQRDPNEFIGEGTGL